MFNASYNEKISIKNNYKRYKITIFDCLNTVVSTYETHEYNEWDVINVEPGGHVEIIEARE